MTSTNRALNRLVLILVGLLLLLAGAAAVAVAVVSGGAARWADLRTSVNHGLQRVWDWQGDLGGVGLGSVPWLLLLVPVAVVLLVVLLVVFVALQGRGRTRDVVADRPLPELPVGASYSVDVAVAQDVVAGAVRDSDAVDVVRVTAYRVGAGTALRVVAGVRRGVPATQAVKAVQQGLSAWDDLAGDRLPAVLHVVRGSRSVQTVRPARATAAVRVETGTTSP